MELRRGEIDFILLQVMMGNCLRCAQEFITLRLGPIGFSNQAKIIFFSLEIATHFGIKKMHEL